MVREHWEGQSVERVEDSLRRQHIPGTEINKVCLQEARPGGQSDR